MGEVRSTGMGTGSMGQDVPWNGRRYSDYEESVTIPVGATGGNVPITIYNDGVYDGSDILILEVTGTDPIGFSNPTYIFSEPSKSQSQTVNVQVIPNGSFKTAAIIINDIRSVTTSNPDSFQNGGAGNDTLNGDDGDDALLGNSGNDTLNGGGGNDILLGNSDNDTLDGGMGNDSIHAGYGNDVLNGKSDNDYLDGFGGDDKLYGEAGNDNLDGWTGNDTLDGGTGDDTLYGGVDTSSDNLGKDKLYGGDGNDTLKGETGDDYLNGGNGNDSLYGGSDINQYDGGNDTLDGGLGIDSLYGRTDNDTYIVDSTTDTITEILDQGTDTVQSSVSYTLGANLENLTLTGSSAINGYGNSLDNVINGNAGNNYVYGGAGNDRLNGSSGNDTLSGGDGDDILSGGLGSNSMSGGIGNDRYGVNSTGDTITEDLNAGTDTVASTVTWTLSANLENLNLAGRSVINGYGNSLDNIINGNAGNNYVSGEAGGDVLNGGEGNDTIIGGDGDDVLDRDSQFGSDSLAGGAGNDRYFVDSTTDTVTENLNAGTDRVDSYISYTLGANLETLALRGSSAINGYGNSLDNRIEGNAANNYVSGEAGNDSLNGMSGNDTLIGGDGNDYLAGDYPGGSDGGSDFLVGGKGNDSLRGEGGSDEFVFYSSTEGIDTIIGFNESEGDKINVSASGFGGGLTIGSVSSSQFTIGSAATDALDRFIYNSSTGGLFFDVDGVGGLGQTQIASLSTGLNLISSDISVIA